MDMDLTNGIVGLQQARLASQIQFAVAGKALDAQKMQGAAAIQLLQAASQGSVQPGDALVAQATGLGRTMDTYA